MMTRNNKMILGVAAGVAALAVAGVYAKKKGYLNNVTTDNLKNKLGGLKDSAMKAFSGSKSGDNMQASSNGADMGASNINNSSSTGGSTKKKSSSNMSTGNVGDINPATA